MAAAMGEQSEELTAHVEALCGELSARLGIEPPVCCVTDKDRMRAGVWLNRHRGRGLLFVSRGTIERLDPGALRWVVAHELGHLADAEGRRHMRVLARLLMLACLAAFVAMSLAPGVGLVLGWLMVIGVSVQGAKARRRLERVADRTAHRLCADDPGAGRRALTALREAAGMRSEAVFRFVQLVYGYPPFDERLAPA